MSCAPKGLTADFLSADNNREMNNLHENNTP